MSKQEKYLTPDIWLGAYLLSQGAKILGIQPHPLQKDMWKIEYIGPNLFQAVKTYNKKDNPYRVFRENVLHLRRLIASVQGTAGDG